MKNLSKYIVIGILVFACAIYLFSRCTLFSQNPDKANTENITEKENTGLVISDEVKRQVSAMKLEEKICQMFFVTPEQLTGVGEVIQAGSATKEKLEQFPVGGIIYSSHNLQTPSQVSELLKNSKSYSKYPLLLGIVEEGGQATAIGENPAMSLGKIEAMSKIKDTESAYEVGEKIGSELSKLGFNVNFAPVADVLDETCDNSLNERSFGTDCNSVSKMVEQFVIGMQKEGVSAVLKHFPGQGFSVGSTEFDYVKTDRSYEEIKKSELLPFYKGIEAGAKMIMLGNIIVSALDAEKPASFSYKIVTELLKNEMGFNGIIISAPMNDGAVLNSHTSGEAAVEAVKAGVDMVLMPNNFEIAYKALIEAVESGDISEDRIDESVMKIMQYKSDKGLK